MGAAIIKKYISQFCIFALLLVLTTVTGAGDALAQLDTSDHSTGLSEISENIVDSSSLIPGLISGVSYLLGLLMGAWGVLRLRDHVENPAQAPLRDPISKFVAGGALLSIPTVYEAMKNAFGDGDMDTDIDPDGIFSSVTGMVSSWIESGNINEILGSILNSFEGLPALIAVFAYLLGLVLGVSAVLKLREHIENPQQTTLKEPVVRFLAGGAMFSLPTLFAAMHKTIYGDGDTTFGTVMDWVGFGSDVAGVVTDGAGGCSAVGGILQGSMNFVDDVIGVLETGAGAIDDVFGTDLDSSFGGGGDSGGNGETVGDVICNITAGTFAFPSFLTAMAMIAGMFVGVWGIMKLKDHALNPQQTQLWDGLIRLIVAGGLMALPIVIEAAQTTIGVFGGITEGEYNGAASGDGLDTMMVSMMNNIYGPMRYVMDFFGVVAGTILVMIAVMRLLKSAQEGPRGPGGIGTIMTFIAGGALLSFGSMVGAFTGSLFEDGGLTYATLSYTEGMDDAVVAHSHAVISAILKFMIVLGLISFARGIFIVREVAEGSSQASMMAGLTHLIGGALAINLGPLINAVQATLGIAGYGIQFS